MLDLKGVGHTKKQSEETIAHTVTRLVTLSTYSSHQNFFPAALCVQGQIHYFSPSEVSWHHYPPKETVHFQLTANGIFLKGPGPTVRNNSRIYGLWMVENIAVSYIYKAHNFPIRIHSSSSEEICMPC